MPRMERVKKKKKTHREESVEGQERGKKEIRSQFSPLEGSWGSLKRKNVT